MLDITTKIAAGAVLFSLASATVLLGAVGIRVAQQAAAERRIVLAEQKLASLRQAPPRAA